MNALNVVPTVEAFQLLGQLREAWSAETSANENWSTAVPALGQCAVSSLVVQDALGGILLRSTVGGVSHYWNRLEDGTEIDVTRAQFAEPLVFGDVVEREREYVLSFAPTAERYRLLREALNI